MLSAAFYFIESIKIFLVVDMFFTCIHWIIDSFEYENYWSEIKNSLKHHNKPHLRGEDTYRSIFNMSLKSTIVIVIIYNFLSFLFGFSIYLTAFEILVYFLFATLAFLNHKFVHTPSKHVPIIFQYLQKLILIDKTYHRAHHDGSRKPNNFSFLFGLIDKPCAYLFNLSYQKIFGKWWAAVRISVVFMIIFTILMLDITLDKYIKFNVFS